MTPDREPRLERFAQDDDLTLLGLGALAWLDRFAAAVERRQDKRAALPEDLVAAALGLLSLRRTLYRWAHQVEVEPPPLSRAPVAPESLMR